MKAVHAPNKQPHQLDPGEYTKWHGAWYAHCPGPLDLVANLSSHQVAENPDGSITVEPSILCGDGKVSWHGYLRAGVWSEA